MESKKDKGTGDLRDWIEWSKKQRGSENISEEQAGALVNDQQKDQEIAEKTLQKFEAKKDKDVAQENQRDIFRLLAKNDKDNAAIRNALAAKGIYAYFILINIGGAVKEIRGVPQYFQLENAKTLIGRYANAHIILDDPNTIFPKHAKIIIEENTGNYDFYLQPIDNAVVTVNGKEVSYQGVSLKSGDRVGIGSADLIFFQKNIDGEEL